MFMMVMMLAIWRDATSSLPSDIAGDHVFGRQTRGDYGFVIILAINVPGCVHRLSYSLSYI